VAKVGEKMNKSVTSVNAISYQSQVVNGTNYKVKASVRAEGKDYMVLIHAHQGLGALPLPVEIKSVETTSPPTPEPGQPGLNIPAQVYSATNTKYNTDLANRQIQVNEWSYNNKMDTLFVFQILFMSLLFAGILLILKNQGYIVDNFFWYSITVVIIIDMVIIINRSVYTNSRRDNRYWNKKRFQEDNLRESPLARGDASYQKYIDSVRSAYGAPEDKCNCPTPAANC
jgi:hypothetical protein